MPDLQVASQVMEEQKVQPVGGNQSANKYLFIAATNKNLEDMVKEGRFRETSSTA